MTKLSSLSIKQKIIGITMLTSTITLVLGSFAFVVNDRYTAKDTMAYIVSSQAKIVSANAAAALLFNDRDAADETLSTISEQKYVAAAGIYTRHGSHFVYKNNHPSHPHTAAIREGRDSPYYDLGDETIDVYHPVMVDGDLIGTVFISASLDVLYANVVNYSSIVLASLLATLGLALFLSSRLQRAVTKPIMDITAITEQISVSKDYSLRIEQKTNDELGHVVSGINNMLKQIEDRDRQLETYAGKLETKVAERTKELELITEQFRHQAYHDELTNLPNRALFLERLNYSISQGERHQQTHAVVFLDLDGFKNINDVLGHDMGDELLIEVGKRLAGSIRSSDTVSRFGGDEFTLLLNDVADIDALEIMARKLLKLLSDPIHCRNREVHLSASIGISLFPRDSHKAIDLMKFADTAMYQAKKIGKNNFQFYSPDIHIESLGRMTTENELRTAISKNELLLYYQPKVDVLKKKITGVEILLRWQHPQKGLLSPEQFIQVAEETGQIIPIGKWVLETACQQSIRWKTSEFANLGIAINLSAIQLYQDNLVETLAQCIRKHNMQPTNFQLELTESMVMNDVGRDREVLMQMRELGISLAIDDFGTGYSCLSQLRNIPVDTVKIDRCFVHDLVSDPKAATVIQAIISLSHAMGLKVVAEGVETEKELQLLSQLGCYEIQGFFFSRPVPAERLQDCFQDIYTKLESLNLPT